MSTVKFGFIGTGNMGAALARAVTKAVGHSEVILADKNTTKAELLANELYCSFGEISAVASSAKFIFMGVKPQVMREALESIKPILKKRTDRFVLVSMAAGLSISSITEMLGENYPIIRIMPNTPVSVGKGMILYTASKEVFMDEVGEFCKALEKSGKLDKLDESLIDAASALSGCGPAFVYMFAQSLADGAVECGLPRDKAILYASQTLSGAAELLLVSGKHAGVLKDEVCSPGGSTIAGVHSLEENSFRGAVMDAVKYSFNRTKELGK
ncbi:MAG: pyrroline-5-carboxylate reductase [Clostridia bacterium]|nr:pyrroline-5-carboxylate reductase [Clostridia bacterium]MBR4973125.1 pyrroline-5-carboxylate reductase [Clostridia bacterium]